VPPGLAASLANGVFGLDLTLELLFSCPETLPLPLPGILIPSSVINLTFFPLVCDDPLRPGVLPVWYGLGPLLLPALELGLTTLMGPGLLLRSFFSAAGAVTALTRRSGFLGSVPAALRVVRPVVPVGAAMMLLSRRAAVPGLAFPVFERAAAFLGAFVVAAGFLATSTAGVLGVGGGGFGVRGCLGVGGIALGVLAPALGIPGRDEGFRAVVGVFTLVDGFREASDAPGVPGLVEGI
jgi:hypothetical protein